MRKFAIFIKATFGFQLEQFMIKTLVSILVSSVVCLSFSVSAETQVIHPKLQLQTDRYMVGLMKIALAHFPGEYSFSEYDELLTRARLAELVKDGQISVLWTGSSKHNDAILAPVHIPAYKGLMGHRVFIIRQGDQGRFDSVRSLADLQRITLGQGRSWSDTKILQNAGFTVVTSNKAEGLFYMLDGARFDGFPRGVHEPWAEVANHPNLQLTVERNLVLKYVMPYYFYISKGNLQLVRDLTTGLEKSIADGSFDRHFYDDVDVKMALEKSDLKNRTIFSISNPNVSNDIPVDKPELWLDFSE